MNPGMKEFCNLSPFPRTIYAPLLLTAQAKAKGRNLVRLDWQVPRPKLSSSRQARKNSSMDFKIDMLSIQDRTWARMIGSQEVAKCGIILVSA